MVFPLKNSRLCDFIIDPHQKIYYVFDSPSLWPFRIELVKISRDEDAAANYPRCIKSSGEAPKQYNMPNVAAISVPEDFEIAIGDELDEEEESEELVVEDNELPLGDEKDEFIKADETSDDDFVAADDDSIDDETAKEGDDF